METNGNNLNRNIKLHERVAMLEVQIKEILENHLPHLQESVDGLNVKLDKGMIFVVITLVGVVIDLILRFF